MYRGGQRQGEKIGQKSVCYFGVTIMLHGVWEQSQDETRVGDEAGGGERGCARWS